METLFSPWRSEYIESFKDEEKRPDFCFICAAVENPAHDDKNLVTARFDACIAILNRYPYNAGHLLIAPLRHVGSIDELTGEELSEMMIRAREATKVIDMVMKPHGYNIGMNLGRTAGAGLPGHVHLHVVPRWNGDANFMSSVAETKVVSQSLAKTREDFARAFAELNSRSK